MLDDLYDSKAILEGFIESCRIRTRCPNMDQFDHLYYWQLVFRRELKIAFVVRGHTHNSASAIVTEHIVSDPDRDLFSCCRIDGFHSLKLDTCLFPALLPLALCLFLGITYVLFYFVFV